MGLGAGSEEQGRKHQMGQSKRMPLCRLHRSVPTSSVCATRNGPFRKARQVASLYASEFRETMVPFLGVAWTSCL